MCLMENLIKKFDISGSNCEWASTAICRAQWRLIMVSTCGVLVKMNATMNTAKYDNINTRSIYPIVFFVLFMSYLYLASHFCILIALLQKFFSSTDGLIKIPEMSQLKGQNMKWLQPWLPCKCHVFKQKCPVPSMTTVWVLVGVFCTDDTNLDCSLTVGSD